MIQLFEIGDNNMVTLNKVWISTVPAFRRLLARDKGGPGDGSGKYKKQATREFTYIYHLVDFHSPLENVPKPERKIKALEYADLAGKENVVDNDADLQDAILEYEYLLNNSSTSLQTLRAMRNARHALNTYLNGVDFTERDDKGQLVHSTRNVTNDIIMMPKTQLALDEMEDKVRAEMLEVEDMRGGAVKGVAEDPDDDD